MKTIEEGNKFIAEFMGYTYKWRPKHNYYAFPEHSFEKEDEIIGLLNLKYHSSWDWLMPVVEKIEKTTQCDIIIHAKNVVDASYNSQTQLYYAGSLLQNAWQAVVEFIEWYNNH